MGRGEEKSCRLLFTALSRRQPGESELGGRGTRLWLRRSDGGAACRRGTCGAGGGAVAERRAYHGARDDGDEGIGRSVPPRRAVETGALAGQIQGFRMRRRRQ